MPQSLLTLFRLLASGLWVLGALGQALLCLEALPAQGARLMSPQAVESFSQTWFDASRGREIAVRFYLPAKPEQACPLIIFSHGLGGDRDGYAYFGKSLASRGFAVLHLQHPGSDSALLGEGRGLGLRQVFVRAAANPQNALERPLDVRFALNRLAELTQSQENLRGRIDLKRVGLAGHSFGAWTALACAGMLTQGPLLSEPGIKAVLAMSPPVSPRDKATPGKYAGIAIPCLILSGDKDRSPLDPELAPLDRRIPYDRAPAGDKYLLILKGADHMLFADRGKADRTLLKYVELAAGNFFAAYLTADAQALAWLKGAGAREEFAGAGVYECK